ncbi:MAG: aspartate-semialdehyde dehydrogenase [Firmicutes bacterium]|nr:aspartate-semialdehyde dehydrogenase [Bacillota bacterium]
MKLAIVGATGMVGKKMLEILEEKRITPDELYLFADKKSKGVFVLTKDIAKNLKVDFVLLAVPAEISKIYAPIFEANNAVIIDNSSAYRMCADVPLCVPEVNLEALAAKKRIIANPNCTTIMAVLPLNALKKFGIKRVIYSTYQAVSGAGIGGISDLKNTSKNKPNQTFKHRIFDNLIPQIDDFLESGYTKEEQKLMDETKKILNLPNLQVSATCVRVPIANCHSASVFVEFEKEFDMKDIYTAFYAQEGLIVRDSPKQFDYPMPIIAENKDEVFIGRIRRDESTKNALSFFISSDNVRKGAAGNAVQILERICKTE